MSTVYFLGAGASKAIDPNFPLATELLPRIVGQWRGRDPDRWAEIRQEIREFLDQNPEPIRALDFESLLSLVDSGLAMGLWIGSYDAEGLKKVRRSLLYCLWIVLAQAETGVPDDSTLEKSHALQSLIWQCLDDPTNLVVTTNYDLLLEDAAAETTPWNNLCVPPPSASIDYGISIRFSLSLDGSSGGLAYERYKPDKPQLSVLKLHGSVNWPYCRQCNAVDWMGIRPLAAAEAHVRDWKCCECHADYDPLVIAPAVGKSLESAPMKRILSIAAERLAAATRIVFAGFSLSQGDAEIHNLLLLARANSKSLAEVMLVDPSAQLSFPRYEGIYGELVHVSNLSNWRDYLTSCIPIKQKF